MKLYTCDPAPNPQRVALFLREKNLDLPTVQLDLRAGDQFAAQFVARNPRCIVPALEFEDGSMLCDAIAICWYLERLHPDPPLMGRTPLEQARILSWDHFLYTDAFLPAAEILRNGHEVFRDRGVPGRAPVPQIPALIERGRLRLASLWPALERQLADRAYLVGDTLTLADIDALVWLRFATRVKAPPPPECSALQAYRERLEAYFAA